MPRSVVVKNRAHESGPWRYVEKDGCLSGTEKTAAKFTEEEAEKVTGSLKRGMPGMRFELEDTSMPREKMKQLHLKDMEPPKIDELEDAAQAYVEARDTRMKYGKDEESCQDELKELMDKHKLKTYTTEDGRLVEVVSGPIKVKVRKPKADANGEDDDDDE